MVEFCEILSNVFSFVPWEWSKRSVTSSEGAAFQWWMHGQKFEWVSWKGMMLLDWSIILFVALSLSLSLSLSISSHTHIHSHQIPSMQVKLRSTRTLERRCYCMHLKGEAIRTASIKACPCISQQLVVNRPQMSLASHNNMSTWKVVTLSLHMNGLVTVTLSELQTSIKWPEYKLRLDIS